MKPEVQHVVSLGCFCHTANHFQTYQIRTCSHPFDWVLSSPAVVLDCLRDDFHTFLNPEYHQKQGDDISNHTVYGTMVLGNNFQGKHPQNIMFTHRDITNPVHLAYYQRCVQRFRDLLASPDSKLFVLTTQDAEFDTEEIQALHQELAKRTTSFHLLCISFFNDYHFHSHTHQDGPVRYMKVHTYGRSDGRGFSLPMENDLFQDALQNLYTFPTRKNVS